MGRKLDKAKMAKSTWTFNPATRIILDKKKDKKSKEKYKEEMSDVWKFKRLYLDYKVDNIKGSEYKDIVKGLV